MDVPLYLQEKSSTHEWRKYTPPYFKSTWDVKTCDGVIVEGVWPNAGKFGPYLEEDVAQIRPAQEPWEDERPTWKERIEFLDEYSSLSNHAEVS